MNMLSVINSVRQLIRLSWTRSSTFSHPAPCSKLLMTRGDPSLTPSSWRHQPNHWHGRRLFVIKDLRQKHVLHCSTGSLGSIAGGSWSNRSLLLIFTSLLPITTTLLLPLLPVVHHYYVKTGPLLPIITAVITSFLPIITSVITSLLPVVPVIMNPLLQ